MSYISRLKIDNYAYQEALQLPFSIPELPQTTKTLILDGFSFGYPAGFLAQLAHKLPNLQQLTLHLQLLGGMDESTWEDAVSFFTRLKELRRLELLDVMPTLWLKPGFFMSIGKALTSRAVGLEKLTISFTSFEQQDEFLRQVPYDDLQYFIMPSLRILFLTVSPEDTVAPPADQDGPQAVQALGVFPIPPQLTTQSGILPALLTEGTAPTDLEYVDLSLFTLTIDQIEEVLQKHTRLEYLHISLYLDPEARPKERLLTALSICTVLQEVNIIYFPAMGFYRARGANRTEALTMAFPQQNEIEALSEKCPCLELLEASILKVPTSGQVDLPGWHIILQPLA
ncbi:MAG: hypothetical protein Q9164_002181 [Protoblastenia rupestris]